MKKIIRSICLFAKNPTYKVNEKLNAIEHLLQGIGYEIQTKRLCSPLSIKEIGEIEAPTVLRSVGTLDKTTIEAQLEDFIRSGNVAVNVEMGLQDNIDPSLVDLLFEIIHRNAAKTFHFTYVFHNRPSTPFFPSASYSQDGFSIGLQSTDLSIGCSSLDEWLGNMQQCWLEIYDLFKANPEFLGIDSSIAPLFSGDSSLIALVNRLCAKGFASSTTTDFYLRCTKFLKNHNPKPVGLCGIMFPCVEDFALAEEYEKNNFSIERNMFLSLHSGLGIDVYPIGVDEEKKRVVEILSVLKGLSEKYNKPLAARFVSDGKARIGQKTDFRNQYFKDVTVRPL